MRRESRFVRVLVAVLAVGACGSIADAQEGESAGGLAPRIVNGVPTAGFPSTGALLSPGNPATASILCSGTLIGCETFLTAAHCVCDELGPGCLDAGAPDPADFVVFLQHAGFFSVASIAVHDDFDFPVADVAVLKLGAPVTGIAPSPLDTLGPPFGTSGTIVGFGRTSGSVNDVGLKRFGAVVTGACDFGISDTTSVCWSFVAPLGSPGTDSNTCFGDSGGPLFVDHGSGEVIAGVTSGGFSESCLPDDLSFDTKVAHYASWIQAEGGADLLNTTCGGMAQVGSGGATVIAESGQLSSAEPQAMHSFAVPAGTQLLRISFNARQGGGADFDLFVRAGTPPTHSSFDCAQDAPSQYGFCEFAAPTAGTWYALMDRWAGQGPYQLTATLFGVDCTDTANDGLPCEDDNPCTAGAVCQSGACAGTPLADDSPCSDGNPCNGPDACQAGVCTGGETPLAGCRTAARSVLLVKDHVNDKRDKLVWRWIKGQATSQAELGDPTTTADYALCLYADASPTPIAQAVVPADSFKWSASGASGYEYGDRSAAAGGIRKIVLKGSAQSKSKAIVIGKGPNLPPVALPIAPAALPLTVQLVHGESAACWQSSFASGDVKKNDAGQLKAVHR